MTSLDLKTMEKKSTSMDNLRYGEMYVVLGVGEQPEGQAAVVEP